MDIFSATIATAAAEEAWSFLRKDRPMALSTSPASPSTRYLAESIQRHVDSTLGLVFLVARIRGFLRRLAGDHAQNRVRAQLLGHERAGLRRLQELRHGASQGVDDSGGRRVELCFELAQHHFRPAHGTSQEQYGLGLFQAVVETRSHKLEHPLGLSLSA